MIGTACSCGQPMEILLPGPTASNPFGTPACVRCARDILGLEDEPKRGGEEMSTGPGRLMRRIVEVVEAADSRSMTRRRLEEAMVAEGYDRSNVLRALRGLHDRGRAHLREGHSLDTTIVSVPKPVRMFTDEEVSRMLETL